MNKVKSCKVKNKIIEVTARTDIFSKIAIISQRRSIELLPVFSYPLGAVPLSLGQPDGTLNKTVKSKLLHKLGIFSFGDEFPRSLSRLLSK